MEILNIIDDHSRIDLVSKARPTTTGPDVPASFRQAFRRYGIPASVLTDNSGVFTLRVDSRLRHIGLGTENARQRILVLVADLHIRVVDAETGELPPRAHPRPRPRPPAPGAATRTPAQTP